MGAAKQAIYFAVGLLLVIGLVTVGIMFYGKAQSGIKVASSEYSALEGELAEQPYLMYEDNTVSGSQVINAIKKFDGRNIGIKVTTGKGASDWYINNASAIDSLTTASGVKANLYNESSTSYVNPNGNFVSKIVRDKNNAIRAIEFVQK
ncbi:hypothetical protein [Metabacillus fastidiosus]|uniref:hypothetical protein n=1 Tax=Metabacillus fastidiosus TaxID=1458 RepID=UPI003D276EBB